jgi:hypothetical protein
MDNILKTILGVLAFAAVLAIIANIINSPIPTNPADTARVEVADRPTNAGTDPNEAAVADVSPPPPVQSNPNSAETLVAPASASSGTIIDNTNFGQPMVDPQPVMQLPNNSNSAAVPNQINDNTGNVIPAPDKPPFSQTDNEYKVLNK